MSKWVDLKPFRFWCEKIIPLIYDESMSYYEVLCKMVEYLNDMINNLEVENEEITKLKQQVSTIQSWIDSYNTEFAESIIREYLATMIFVDISDAGYIVYHIPENWKSIQFQTTGLDVQLALQPEYGHLVLSY